jgi:hypothetical protein
LSFVPSFIYKIYWLSWNMNTSLLRVDEYMMYFSNLIFLSCFYLFFHCICWCYFILYLLMKINDKITSAFMMNALSSLCLSFLLSYYVCLF